MAEWHKKWEEARPRWGTFSVKAHTDLRRLITDLLLYDVLVFPCPSDEEDFKRWEDKKWDPELLARRVIQLGDHAVTTPWDQRLRAIWSERFQRLAAMHPEDEDIAYDLTASMMSEQSFVALMGLDDDRLLDVAAEKPTIHPEFAKRDARARLRAGETELELVAAYQDVAQARRLTGALPLPGGQPPNAPVGDVGVRLRLEIDVPADADEETLFRALELVKQPDYQAARRRLWSWESELRPEKLDVVEVQVLLDGLLRDYNNAVNVYNAYIRQFPQVITAKVTGAKARKYYQAAPGSETAPTVDFSRPAPGTPPATPAPATKTP